MKKKFKGIISALLAVSMIPCFGAGVFAAEERVTVDMVLEAGTNNKDYEEVERLMHVDNTDIIDQTIDATITWDETSEPIIRDDLRDMWGIQYESNRGGELMADEQGNLRKEFLDVADQYCNETVVRWGGGSSNGYNLGKMILPMKQRERGVDYRTGKSQNEDLNYGPVEFIKVHQAINPDVKFCWCISPWSASAEDNANFIHFLLDDEKTQWGALRESWGIHGPVPIWGLEIGNEDYFTSEISEEDAKAGTDEYIARFRENVALIHAIDPTIKCIPNVNGNSFRAGFYEWNRPIVKQLGPEFKIMAFHLYYSGYEYAYNHVWIEDLLALCEEELGPDNGIQLAFTEHAKWDTATCWSRAALGSALATGQFLNIISQRPEIPMATIHCGMTGAGTGSKWSFLTKYTDDTLQYSALNPLYSIYIDNVGDRVLKTDVLSDSPLTDPESTARHFTALATPKGKKELRLFMVNREAYTDFNLTFDTKNNYTLKKEIVFTAPNVASFSFSKKCEDVYRITETDKNEPLKTYHMPNKSLVCLILESKQNIGAGGEEEEDGTVVYKGDDKFEDISEHWAKNEINLLADAGVVTGVGENIYDPDSTLTVGEFATMLTRALKMDAVGNDIQAFDNITPEMWYYKPLNTMALKGYIRRSKFLDPDAPVTLDYVMGMLYQIAGNRPIEDQASFESRYPWFGKLNGYQKSAFAYGIGKKIISKLFETEDADPLQKITRGETAAIIYQAMSKLAQ